MNGKRVGAMLLSGLLIVSMLGGCASGQITVVMIRGVRDLLADVTALFL